MVLNESQRHLNVAYGTKPKHCTAVSTLQHPDRTGFYLASILSILNLTPAAPLKKDLLSDVNHPLEWKNHCITALNGRPDMSGQKRSLYPGQEGRGWTGSRHPGGHNDHNDDDDTLIHHRSAW